MEWKLCVVSSYAILKSSVVFAFLSGSQLASVHSNNNNNNIEVLLGTIAHRPLQARKIRKVEEEFSTVEMGLQ